jgi:A/G-specific adenine glycosylase
MTQQVTDPAFVPLRPWGELAHNLLGWYDTVHANRDMPWRQTRDPYAIWLSETMLQQTQVATVKPYYGRFLARFPTVADLARADLDEVLALWAGLGYYRRARHLHAAAKAMVERHDGAVPSTLEELLTLPGVGRYTAGAVASIAYGIAAPVVDGNVMRVVARLSGFDRNIADPKNAPFFWHAAGEIVEGAAELTEMANGRNGEPTKGAHGQEHPREPAVADSPARPLADSAPSSPRYGDVNQALMELGATVCVPPPARPACLLCPVKGFCRAFAEGKQLDLPVKAKKKAVPEVRGLAAVVIRSPKPEAGSREENAVVEVLMMRRPAGVTWEGMWEFPVLAESAHGRQGKRKAATSPDALGATIGDALGLKVTSSNPRGEVIHTLTHRRMIYDVVCCQISGGGDKVHLPPCLEGGTYVESRWVPWPLEKATSGVACGRVVEKIAAAAVS